MKRIRILSLSAVLALAASVLAPGVALAATCITPVYGAQGQILLVTQSCSLPINTSAAVSSASVASASSVADGTRGDSMLISGLGSATIVAIANVSPFSIMSESAPLSQQVFEVTNVGTSPTIVAVVPAVKTTVIADQTTSGTTGSSGTSGSTTAGTSGGSTTTTTTTTTTGTAAAGGSTTGTGTGASVAGLPSTSTAPTTLALLPLLLMAMGGVLVLATARR